MYLPLNPFLVGSETPIEFWVGWLPIHCTSLPRLEYPGTQVQVQLFSPPDIKLQDMFLLYILFFIENYPKIRTNLDCRPSLISTKICHTKVWTISRSGPILTDCSKFEAACNLYQSIFFL